MTRARKQAVAIRYVAVFYGLPEYGHTNCYKNARNIDRTRSEYVGHEQVGIDYLCCIGCGKPLLPQGGTEDGAQITLALE